MGTKYFIYARLQGSLLARFLFEHAKSKKEKNAHKNASERKKNTRY